MSNQPVANERSRVEERFISATDGTQILLRTYQPTRSRAAPLVFLDGLGCEGYAWAYLIEYFRGERPLVYWQYRGHGRSEVPRELDSLTMEQVVQDLGQVMQATRTKRAVLCGHSMGVQVALEAYRAFPEQVKGLILVCGGYEYPLETWHGAPERDAPPTVGNRLMRRMFPYITGAFLEFPEQTMRLWRRVVPTRTMYEFAVRSEVNGRRIDHRDFWPYLQHLGEMDMRVFARFAQALAAHSASDLLEQIRVPTLIIGGGRDTFTPVWLSEEMWRRIPESEYLHIPDGSHATPIEHPQLINLRVEKFFRERIDIRARPAKAASSQRRAPSRSKAPA